MNFSIVAFYACVALSLLWALVCGDYAVGAPFAAAAAVIACLIEFERARS